MNSIENRILKTTNNNQVVRSVLEEEVDSEEQFQYKILKLVYFDQVIHDVSEEEANLDTKLAYYFTKNCRGKNTKDCEVS